MSGKGRFADLTRTLPEVREGPILFSNSGSRCQAPRPRFLRRATDLVLEIALDLYQQLRSLLLMYISRPILLAGAARGEDEMRLR